MEFLFKLFQPDAPIYGLLAFVWSGVHGGQRIVHVFLPVLWRWGYGVSTGDQLSDSKDTQKKRSRHQEVSDGTLLPWEPDWIPICNLPPPHRIIKEKEEEKKKPHHGPLNLSLWMFGFTK